MEMDERGGGVWDQRNALVFCDIPVRSPRPPHPPHGKGMLTSAAAVADAVTRGVFFLVGCWLMVVDSLSPPSWSEAVEEVAERLSSRHD